MGTGWPGPEIFGGNNKQNNCRDLVPPRPMAFEFSPSGIRVQPKLKPLWREAFTPTDLGIKDALQNPEKGLHVAIKFAALHNHECDAAPKVLQIIYFAGRSLPVVAFFKQKKTPPKHINWSLYPGVTKRGQIIGAPNSHNDERAKKRWCTIRFGRGEHGYRRYWQRAICPNCT